MAKSIVPPKKTTNAVKWVWRLFFLGLLLLILIFTGVNYGLFGAMPTKQQLENPSALVGSEVYADDGTPMGMYYLEDRNPVEYAEISPLVINALIATEDERFYEHSGIDGKALLRAVTGVLTFDRAGGGSTITQQLALNLFGGQRSSNKLERGMQKFKEWVIAVKLERNFTKDEIVTYYLNTVAFGDNVYGIKNAALTFFQKEPIDLDLSESATLIGMLKANTYYNPRRFPERSRLRRNTVIDQMVRNNFVKPDEAEKVKATEIDLNYRKITISNGIAPYFRESIVKQQVRDMLKDMVNPSGEPYDIYKDGLKIYTTINPKMQLYAEEAVAKNMAYQQRILSSFGNIKTGTVFNGREKEMERFVKQTDRWRFQKEGGLTDEENRKTFNVKVPMKVFAWNKKREMDTTMTPLDSIKYHKTMLQTGFIAMEPQTGHVKAWVGGIDFRTFKLDHANLNVKRQVGSTIKPMLYCQAIEDIGLTPESPIPNVQQYFPGSGYLPASGKGARGGTNSMARSIALSLNGAAAYLTKQIGPQRFVEFLEKCRVQTKLTAYPSNGLGACDLSLYEMIWMYSMFPGRGFNVRPQIVTRIEDRNGNVLVNVQPDIKEVVSEVTAYTMCKMMNGAIRFGTATRLRNYDIPAEMGAKTGTTNDNTDAWFMAYSPELLMGTWVGCDENWIHFPSASGAGYGGAAALPTVGNFVKSVYADKKLGYDKEAKFIKPEIDKNEIIFDYIEGNSGYGEPDAAGEDMGNGDAEDYLGEDFYKQQSQQFDTTGLGEIGGESEYIQTDKSGTKKAGTTTDNKAPKDTSTKKPANADVIVADTSTPEKKKPKALFRRRNKDEN